MKGIVFVKSLSDFDFLKNKISLPGKQIIALSFEAYFFLTNNRYNVKPYWAFGNNDTINALLNNEKDVIDLLWTTYFQYTEYGEYALINYFELIMFIHEALNANFYIENILKDERPDHVYNLHYPDSSVFEGNLKCSVFDNCLEYILSQHNIAYHKVEDGRTTKSKKIKKSFSQLQYLVNFVKGAIVYPYWRILGLSYKNRIALSSISVHEQSSRFKWFFDKLAEKTNYKLIHLGSHASLKYLDYYLDGFFSKSINKRKGKSDTAALSALFGAYLKSTPAFTEISRNSFLNYHWEYLIGIVVNSKLRYEQALKRKYELLKPRIAFFSQAHKHYTLISSIILRKSGVKTFILPHATVPYSYKELYENFDHILTTGNYQVIHYSNLGINRRNIFLATEGRYNKSADDQVSTLKLKYNIKEGRVIAVVTNDIQSQTGLFPKWECVLSSEKFYNYILACKDLAGEINNSHIVIKSHPLFDYYGLYDALMNENVSHYSKKPIADFLTIADIIIFVGPNTDVIFEASLFDKPMIFCNCGSPDIYIDSIKKGLKVINDPHSLLHAVEEILSNKSKLNISSNIAGEFLKIETDDQFELLQGIDNHK